jgi:hypothetical protein
MQVHEVRVRVLPIGFPGHPVNSSLEAHHPDVGGGAERRRRAAAAREAGDQGGSTVPPLR